MKKKHIRERFGPQTCSSLRRVAEGGRESPAPKSVQNQLRCAQMTSISKVTCLNFKSETLFVSKYSIYPSTN